ncbi:hypothetical protein T484DRAFT_1802382 [Baffinella frigidus]|nr:hypothetical protein T484DRAFT_1802382 [Cryptophyta sp. CCMP2293]
MNAAGDRPFSRMNNFFVLEHGDKWARTGTKFRPRNVADHPSLPLTSGAETAGRMGHGAVLEVRLADGVWYRGRLVERVAGTEPPLWIVQFDDGESLDDICLANPAVPVRFDAGAYGATVEVRVAGEWCRGRLVELVRGQWGVAFEGGGWAEDVRLGGPDVRYVFAGRGGGDAGDGEGSESRKRGGAESGGGDRSGGGARTASSRAQKMPAHEEEEESEEETASPKIRRLGEAGGEVGKNMQRVPGGGTQSWLITGPCAYPLCPCRESASRFTLVREWTRPGGAERDWSGLVGQTLCKTCFDCFNRTGGLERQIRFERSWSNVGPCGYTLCPCKSAREFTVVVDGAHVRGAELDWSGVVGQRLCRSCHEFFLRTGGVKLLASPKVESEMSQSKSATSVIFR